MNVAYISPLVAVPRTPRNAEAERLLRVIAHHDDTCEYCFGYVRWAGPLPIFGYAPGCNWAQELSWAFIRAQTMEQL